MTILQECQYQAENSTPMSIYLRHWWRAGQNVGWPAGAVRHLLDSASGGRRLINDKIQLQGGGRAARASACPLVGRQV